MGAGKRVTSHQTTEGHRCLTEHCGAHSALPLQKVYSGEKYGAVTLIGSYNRSDQRLRIEVLNAVNLLPMDSNGESAGETVCYSCCCCIQRTHERSLRLMCMQEYSHRQMCFI